MIHAASPASVDWDTAATVVTAVAAIIALGISISVAKQQHRIQEQQLKQDLFDKRYAVFASAERFIAYVLWSGGAIQVAKDEFRDFQIAAEKAEFLFDGEVSAYMRELEDAAMKVRIKVQEANVASTPESKAHRLVEVDELLAPFTGRLVVERKRVFGQYLRMM